ncbi:class III lanthionine synthetase LanKC [Actinomadura decatromicini]|uniref:Protein kinase/lanthionine synthetase C family protein n=1 Tax=Actinomadura decatromicini TaxID=2604572 RepID=A0A5D3F9G6_9ACTN|nr:class III lanthionine synthetase LanKC [Actinomadura decatromicini]TYK44608.1 protein kinase/lanthionine synthetase C family protein [Actinomadura decatromicini]
MKSVGDYDRFYVADPDFFEVPDLLPDEGSRLSFFRSDVPAGWQRVECGWWVRLVPAGGVGAEQGWMIHVSVVERLVERTVEIVRRYCLQHSIAFEGIRSRRAARALNAKRADRRSSGRIVTLFPTDEERFARVLADLELLLGGLSGAYVLGALRHGDGPLYCRYGSFEAATETDEFGEPVRRLRRPDGRLVVEDAGLVFRPPEWVSIPAVLDADLRAMRAGEFPYRIERVLAICNAGGTYVGVDRASGTRVVLREARPFAGVDERGEDAVARLDRHRSALERAAGLEGVPELLGYRTFGGHRFLVEEFVDGVPLRLSVLGRLPLLAPQEAVRESEDVGTYSEWAMGVLDQVMDVLDGLLRHGIRLGELDPDNVVLRPDGRVALVDLESGVALEDDRAPAVDTPQFRVPAGLSGAAAHEYLVSRLRLWMFLPLQYHERTKVRTLAEAVVRHYPVPSDFGASLVRVLGCEKPDSAGDMLDRADENWPEIRESLIRGIHAVASPERRDRLFPGTPTTPTTIGGYPFAYGAAGVLYALSQAGAEIPGEYVEWLVKTALDDPAPRPGLYDGLHGVVFVLDYLGHRDEALAVLHRSQPLDETVRSADLDSGLAGIALNLLHFARVTGDEKLRARAVTLGDDLAARTRDGFPAVPGRPAPFGLLHGPTGAALFFQHLHAETGESRCLDLADVALRRDLDRCVTRPDGTLYLFDGSRHLPYLHGGSHGLAFVLRNQLRHRPADDLRAALAGIRRACRLACVHDAGLFRGRAGMIATAAGLGFAEDRPAIRDQVRRLAWHARRYQGHLAFPGFRMRRLSMDLATGSAGVLLALNAAFGEHTGILPHLDSRTGTTREHGGGR